MERLPAMECACAGDDALGDFDDFSQWRALLLGEPLGEGGAIDGFEAVVKEAARGFSADCFDQVLVISA